MNKIVPILSFIFCVLNISCHGRAKQKSEEQVCSNFTLNVRDFGAKGDGAADDTESIQQAINAGVGKTIFFPRGNYRVTRPLILPNSIKLLGEGDVGGAGGMVISSGVGKDLSAIFTAKGNLLEDVILENIRTLGSKSGIYLNVANGGAFTKVKIYNCVFQDHDICIEVDGGILEGMYANIIRDSYFKASRLGIFCEGTYNINTIESTGFENMKEGYLSLGKRGKTALGNSFLRNRCEAVIAIEKGTGLSLNQATYGFVIDGNYFENSFRHLIQLNGAKNVQIQNNVATSDSSSAYYLIEIGEGHAGIINNVGLTGFILDIGANGFVWEVAGNSFLNYTSRIQRSNLGRVLNIYNRKFDKEK
ncbi:glycosyl hydrolase family 28-related protein [Sphingobacterium sp. WOUb80]|uniref:glycosyl hydrolase family 28-related protein n=1 Tax=Sphingobacterium sp. WOUb80 TaxID=3234028 RepID=UPI003CE97E06